MNIYKIVLTGGPGGGKSTIVEEIQKKYNKKGDTRVIVISETASIMAGNNLKPIECDYAFAFQNEVYHIQKTREEAAERLASHFPEKNIIIVYDRGILDNRAYLNKGEFETILYNHKDSEMNILDKYDLVINLMTAAHLDGKYLKETNPHRTENAEFAKDLDVKTLDSWLLHRNIYNVEATDNFDDKINRVMQIIDENLNKSKEQQTIFDSNNYSGLKNFIDKNEFKCLFVQDYYLVNQDKKKIIISKRSLGNDTSFLYKEIDLSNNNEIIKTEYLLDELQVIKLSRIHPPKVRIEKNIYRFVYDNQIFEIESCDGKYLLRVINKDPNKPVKLPKGLYSLDKVDERIVEEAMPIFYRSRYLK